MLTANQMAVAGAGDQSEEVSHQEKMNGKSESNGTKSLVKPSGQFIIRDELLNRTHKLLGLLNTTLQHLQLEGLFNYLNQGLAIVKGKNSP